MRFLLSSAALLSLCVSYGSAQELITNGDFSSALTGWSSTGGGALPGIATENVTGGGANSCFKVHPDRTAPRVLSQAVMGVPQIPHLLNIDVHMYAVNGNAQGGYLEVYLGTTMVYTWTKYIGSIAGGTSDRQRLTAVVKFAATGKQAFELRFVRPKYTAHATTPKISVDNISLVRGTTNPVLMIPNERMIGGTLNVNMTGTAGHAGVTLLAGKGGPKIALPPFGGTLQLHLASLMIFTTGVFDGSGVWNQPIPVPNDSGLKGIQFALQGVQVGASNSFGNAQIGIAIKP